MTTTGGAAAVARLLPLLKKYKKSFRTAGEMIRFSDPLDDIKQRLSALEAEVALLRKGNAVTRVTKSRGNGNAMSPAEKMRRYRERKKAKSV